MVSIAADGENLIYKEGICEMIYEKNRVYIIFVSIASLSNQKASWKKVPQLCHFSLDQVLQNYFDLSDMNHSDQKYRISFDTESTIWYGADSLQLIKEKAIHVL